jgi:hypothetical protein
MNTEQRNEYIAARKLLDQMHAPLPLCELDELMLGLIRQHWAHAENHGRMTAMFRHAEYNFDAPGQSSMSVEPLESFAEDENLNPGIYVAGTQADFVKVAVGNLEEYNDDNSVRTSSWQCVTGLRVAHINQSPKLARGAAESTMSFLISVAPALMDRLDLKSFDPQQVSVATKIGKSPERTYRVDASVKIVFTWSVSMAQEGHRLKLVMSEINPLPYSNL